MNIVVIGAGMGGLSAAIRLRAKGHQVTVLETADSPGGKLSSAQFGEYRFDLGPSLFTMPHLMDELFHVAGKNPNDYFRYKKLDSICHYFYPDGTQFTSHSDSNQFAQTIEKKLGVPQRVLKKYLSICKRIHSITTPLFLYKSLHRFSSYFSWDSFLATLQLPLIRGLQTMDQVNKTLLKEPHLVQYFNRFATYNGSNPYAAPGTLNLIAHLEHSEGAYIPEGGMISITNSLFKLATEIGVNFQFNTRVTKILHSKNRIKGIEINHDKVISADIVISNMDVTATYSKLLTDIKAPEKILRQEKSSSALIFYWGIKKEFSQLGLHNIFFSEDYRKEFECIWKEKSITNDPTVYINITSKYEKGDAPKGGENWFVMINVPCNEGQNWDDLRQTARKAIIKKLNKELSCDVESLIEVEEYLDPIRIEQRTGSHKGALYGNASNSRMAAFFRHSNASSTIKGLFFVGGSVHPGGGVPLALLSGKITAKWISDKYQ